MTIQISPQHTQVIYDWSGFKTKATSFGLRLRYHQEVSTVTVYFYDPPEVHLCCLARGGAEEAEFLASYLPLIQDSPLSEAILTAVVSGELPTAATAQAAVRKTAYVERTSEARRSIKSTSALDTNGGTGARQVQLTYYDDAGDGPFTEVVLLNGLTAVDTTATNIRYLARMEVTSVGSTGTNQGTIEVYNGTGGGATGSGFGSIAVGDNQTLWAHHYVAANRVCYVNTVAVNSSSATAANASVFTLKVKTLNSTSPEVALGDRIRLIGATSHLQRVYGKTLRIRGPARIQAYVQPETISAVTQRVSFDLYEVAP